jgi:hypothetical protein
MIAGLCGFSAIFAVVGLLRAVELSRLARRLHRRAVSRAEGCGCLRRLGRLNLWRLRAYGNKSINDQFQVAGAAFTFNRHREALNADLNAEAALRLWLFAQLPNGAELAERRVSTWGGRRRLAYWEVLDDSAYRAKNGKAKAWPEEGNEESKGGEMTWKRIFIAIVALALILAYLWLSKTELHVA